MPLMISLSGGSGSGKTTLAKAILSHYKDASLFALDNYYKNREDLPLDERAKLNYDSPETFDSKLLLKHLSLLKRGEEIDMPLWDMATHSRKKETLKVSPSPIILVDGILTLQLVDPNEFDLNIFVHADSDTRLGRRLLRDLKERGRTPESVVKQYIKTVKPMHILYVEKAKNKADIIFNNESDGELDQKELEAVFALIDTKIELSKNRQ